MLSNGLQGSRQWSHVLSGVHTSSCAECCGLCCMYFPMSLWLPCGLHGFAVPNTVTVTVWCWLYVCRLLGVSKEASFEEIQDARNYLFEVRG